MVRLFTRVFGEKERSMEKVSLKRRVKRSLKRLCFVMESCFILLTINSREVIDILGI